MNPNPEQAAAIRAKIEADGLGPDVSAIVEALNAPAIDNPTPQPTRPKPYTLEDLMAALDTATIGKLQSLPSLDRMLDRIEANDRLNCKRWINLLVASGTITAEQMQSIAAILDATEPDPGWKPQLSWAQVNIGRPVDGFDVMAAVEP